MYEVVVEAGAAKHLGDLSQDVVSRVARVLSSGCGKIRGTDDVYRVRVGDYRVLYSVHDNLSRLEVVAIGHRKDVYR